MPIVLTLVVTLAAYLAINGSRLAIVLHGLALGATPFEAGVLAGLLALLPLLIGWPVGRLADRYGARWLMVAGASAGAIGLLLPYFIPGLPTLFIAAALAGLWNALFHVTTQSLVQVLSTSKDLSRNFVFYSMTGSISNFVGPVLGGNAIEHLGHEGTFLALAAVPVVCVALLLALGGCLPRGNAAPAEKSGLLATLGEREVLRLLGISALVQLSFDLFPLFIPIYGRSIGISPSTIGYIVGAVFVAAFGIQLVLARVVRRLGERDILTFSFGVAMCCFLGMPMTVGALSLGAVACLFGLAMGAGHPVTSMLLSSRAPNGRPAETLGFRLSINYTLRFVGPTALGTLGTAFGLVPMFAASAALMACGGFLCRRLPFRSHDP